MKHSVRVLLFLLPLAAFSRDAGNPERYYRRLEGSVCAPAARLAITMNILRLDRDVAGSYYYNRFGRIIDLNGAAEDDGRIRLSETAADSVTGFFKFEYFGRDSIVGAWQDPESTVSYPFLLLETYPSGSARCAMRHFERTLGGSEMEGSYRLDHTWPAIDRFPEPGIQDSINRRLSAAEDTLELEKSMAADYEDLKASGQDDTSSAYYYTRQWEDRRITRIVANGDFVLSLETYHYEYTGGAHPNTSLSLVSYDLRTGRPIALQDLIQDRGQFDRIAEEVFRRSRGLNPGDDLDSCGYWFEDDRFAVNDNCLFTPAGVRFVYNPYEIAPYAAGPIELLVPYARLKSILKKNHPLRGWIKE